MGDSTSPDLDLREFLNRVRQEYEDVIATLIQRPLPLPRANAERRGALRLLGFDDAAPAEGA